MKKPCYLEDMVANKLYELPCNGQFYSIGRGSHCNILIDNPSTTEPEEMSDKDKLLVSVSRNQGRIRYRQDGVVEFVNDSSRRVKYGTLEEPEKFTIPPEKTAELGWDYVLSFGIGYAMRILNYNSGQERLRLLSKQDTKIIISRKQKEN